MRQRLRIEVQGTVQGVGFRPFVFNLAKRHELGGFVLNDSDGALIEAEGENANLQRFLVALRAEAPPLAALDALVSQVMPARGCAGFEIAGSESNGERRVLITPDAAVCDECIAEMFDANDRRHRYPFINCTNCGPRFTIVEDVPYDRALTTMRHFAMCERCRSEYEDPRSRRFHAQPNACPDCGPRLTLLTDAGDNVAGDAIRDTARVLRDGCIVAIKGIGGYHLACDASNEEAVARLRSRKHREVKPFALMVRDEYAAGRIARIDSAERDLLTAVRRPIVLLRERPDNGIAASVSPGQRNLGVMLPYTPLHHLLLRDFDGPLVMTSGNVSDEPIAYRDDDARERLGRIADYLLVHDREIETRCDDSVTRVVAGRERVVRRSRGYVPSPLKPPRPFVAPVLATGGQLKSTFCLGKDDRAFVSHHIGDLDDYETLCSFEDGIEHFRRLFDVRPEVVAFDLHPEYASTKYALSLPGVRRFGVQHHHAHIAACMAEHGLAGEVIGVAFDGSGYGTDGTVWGGEFLIASYEGFARAAHLDTVPIPGGEAAIRNPWRVAAAWLHQLHGLDLADLSIDFTRRLEANPWPAVRSLIESGVNCPRTSSMGRLFDAVASLIGVRDVCSYEGQAAIELEMVADERETGAYEFRLHQEEPLRLDPGPVLREVVEELQRGTEARIIAARFHNAVVQGTVETCAALRDRSGHSRVVLCGGVFQNALLLQRVSTALESRSFDVFAPSLLPANDGGISFGQAVIANARLAAEVSPNRAREGVA